MTGYIHSIETLGALDGPGLRTIFFLQGCPLRCAFCHNPDTHKVGVGQIMSVEQAVQFALRYRAYYGASGGVTLSGGEPLVQRKFCLALIEALKTEGIGVAIDTSGCIFAPEVLDACDLVILDIKHTDAAAFKKLTGGDFEYTLKTLDYVQKTNRDFWVRQVVLPTINDTDEQILALARLSVFAKRAQLLAYHKMGIDKYKALGVPYSLDIDEPTAATMQRLQALLDAEIERLKNNM